MKIGERANGRILLAKVCDARVDAGVAGDFKRQLLDVVDAGHDRIALDLSEVEFIDSSGIGAIVAAFKSLGGRGELIIVGARPAVQNLFRLTRLDKVFRMYGGEADAIAALSF